MPGTPFESDADFDPQDRAESFDEANLEGGAADLALGDDSPLGEDMRTFEELPEVEDLTQAAGDRDDDEALALDADEFDPETIGDGDLEEDNELDYHAADEEREDDIDGLGPESAFDAGRVGRAEVSGLTEVRDAGEAEGGEDDFTDFQAARLDDDDLDELGYSGEGGRR